MYRIRFHGRGGHGMKTAGRILGTALFGVGFEVQDAPRYGAERRGAPLFAYVRADRSPILERGVILHPDLVVVADESLIPLPTAGVTAGLDPHTVLLIRTGESADTWRKRLNAPGPVVTLPPGEAEERAELPFIGATCAAAAARLTGEVAWPGFQTALREELIEQSEAVVAENLRRARAAFDAVAEHEGAVTPRPEPSAAGFVPPHWIDLPFEEARLSAPTIHAAATSEALNTGAWRTLRPVVDAERCNGCVWICSSYCPDGAITSDEEGMPLIDYDHCKGCMVCLAQCPPHAIEAVAEEVSENERE